MGISAQESQPQPAPGPTIISSAAQVEVEFAICDCCGFTEECTPAYIKRVRERYSGKWICGLCAEAVKDEITRTGRLISAEEAMDRHINFCKKFMSPGPPPDPIIHLISVMRQILRKRLESRSTPNSPTRAAPMKSLARSESCFPAMTGWRSHNKGRFLPRPCVKRILLPRLIITRSRCRMLVSINCCGLSGVEESF